MYTFQFQKIDPYDWFCAPGLHIPDSIVMEVNFILMTDQ